MSLNIWIVLSLTSMGTCVIVVSYRGIVRGYHATFVSIGAIVITKVDTLNSRSKVVQG